jgi:hypothetical protein
LNRLLVFVFFCIVPVVAQSPAAHPAKTAAPPAAVSAVVKDLPVRKVVLYKNGVGYFEHAGTVTGNQKVGIDFTSSQLNDVLQSLTVLDGGGGRIAGVNYNSTTPLAEQLKSLSLGMTDDPTSTELFQALRGQRVEVTGAPGGVIAGRLMSIESRTEKAAKSEDPGDGGTVDKFYLTVVATSGAVRVIELTPALSVRPLDANLQGQLDRYLQLLSSTRSTGLRHLTMDALGQGQRQLQVSYISEVPVWKSTYRLVFPRVANGSATMQGWAVVDNTVGADWDNVQLSLVAGAPQSFIQPLSQPLYTRRPEIPIATEAQTTPQTHESGEDENRLMSSTINGQLVAPRSIPHDIRTVAEKQAPPASFGVAGMEGLGGSIHGANGGPMTGTGSGSGNGFGAGVGGNIGGGIYRASGVDRVSDAIQEGDVSTNAFDDFFEYSLAQPVTIHQNESAMVPILQQEFPAEHVTLWSDRDAQPLRAVWLENKSNLTLDSGSFSIFESGEFAGEGLLDPIHPGEKRLLSYAADQAVRVHHGGFAQTRTLHHIAMHQGLLVESTTQVDESNYTVTNAAPETRTVIVEHPRKPNATLDSEVKPTETTATAYRFRVIVEPHQSVTLHVGERATFKETIRIAPGDDRTGFIVSVTKLAPGLEEKLKPLMDAEKSLSDLNRKIGEIEAKEKTLSDDEARDRDNLTALKGNDAGKRFVEELNRAEDDIQQARKDREGVEKDRDAARAQVEAIIDRLAFDQDLDVVTESNQFGDRRPNR